MTLTSRYDHRVTREYIDPDTSRRECLICGQPTTGAGAMLRHFDEAVRPALPERGDVDAFREAVAIARTAQDRLLPPGWTEDDIARVVIEDLYAAGALRTRRAEGRGVRAGRVA
jgi:hypothetical protein